jgi:hypothetical protein
MKDPANGNEKQGHTRARWQSKGNNQERRGELELTMASKNNCKGERQ